MLSTTDPAQRMLGRHLIDMVDKAGYLTRRITPKPLNGWDATTRCWNLPSPCYSNANRPVSAPATSANAWLCNSRSATVTTRRCRNCLIISTLLARADYDRLQKICEVDRDDLRDMVAEIKQLNPKPGIGFESDEIQAVAPDIIIRRKKPEGWHIELNPANLPRVLVNERYFTELSGQSRSKDDKKYLTEQMNHASWLVKALDMRAKTMLKVSSEIVARQSAFFRHGIRYLVPLTLREVADAIEMHESTVSRVTTQKYMATPRGMFELKYFFTSSINSSLGGEEISSKAVQHLIAEAIEKETTASILSDEALVEILKGQGVDVARRTVAKYREQLNIPSAPPNAAARKRNSL